VPFLMLSISHGCHITALLSGIWNESGIILFYWTMIYICYIKYIPKSKGTQIFQKSRCHLIVLGAKWTTLKVPYWGPIHIRYHCTKCQCLGNLDTWVPCTSALREQNSAFTKQKHTRMWLMTIFNRKKKIEITEWHAGSA
jgi:hypothetical protein